MCPKPIDEFDEKSRFSGCAETNKLFGKRAASSLPPIDIVNVDKRLRPNQISRLRLMDVAGVLDQKHELKAKTYFEKNKINTKLNSKI